MAEQDREASGPDAGCREAPGDAPELAGGIIGWLDRPWVRWVRIPLGLLFVVVGVFGFLPVLGFWMVPLGLVLLAQDLPFLRKPVRRLLCWVQRRLPRRGADQDAEGAGHGRGRRQ